MPVADHERAIAFYTQTLGFEKRRDATFGPGLRWVEVAPSGSTTTVALAPRRDGASTEHAPTLLDSGIRLAVPDAGAAHAELRASGADVDADVLRFGGEVPPMFFLRDPDGNQLVIVEAP